MKRTLPIAGALVLIFATPGFAHRLDEYLQATTILVSHDRVQLQVRLVPGVAVLPIVLASMDTDGNGIVSGAEQAAYAERVVGDLSLTIDGEQLPLRMTSATFAPIEDLRRGLGESTLDLEAKLPPGQNSRRLVFENTHQTRIAAYLVNALVPSDPRIRIGAQNRDYRQSTVALDFTQAAEGTRFMSFDVLLRYGVMFVAGALLLFQFLRTKLRRREAVTSAVTAR